MQEHGAFDIAMLVLAAIAAVTGALTVLPLLGIDIRIFGRTKVPSAQGKPRIAKRVWLALTLAIVSLGLSAGAFYYFFRPRTFYKTVTEEKRVPEPCPQAAPEVKPIPKTIQPKHPKLSLAEPTTPDSRVPVPSQNCPNGICNGGDNNGTQTVNNYGTTERRISEDQKKSLIPILKQYPSEVSVVLTNTGNRNLANDWHNLFAAAGWQTNGIGSLTLTSGKIRGVEVIFPGEIPKDHTMYISPKTPASAIRDAFATLGYTPHFSQEPTMGNVITVIVGADDDK